VKATGLVQETHVKVDPLPCLEILSLQFLINITSSIILSVYESQYNNRLQNTTSFKGSITDHQQVLTRRKEAAHLAYSVKSQLPTPARPPPPHWCTLCPMSLCKNLHIQNLAQVFPPALAGGVD